MNNPLKLTIVFFLLFLDFGIVLGPLKLPFFSSILTIFITGLSVKSIKRALIVFALLCAFGSLGYFTSQSGTPLVKVLSTLVQSTISFFIFFSLLNYSNSFSNHFEIEKASKYILVFMLSMLLLERSGLIESFSLEFARIIYTGETGFRTYENTYSIDRDIALAGFRRPTLFSPEPSIAAIGLSIILIIRNLFTSSTRSKIIDVILVIAVWFLIKSPIALLALFVVFSKELIFNKEASTKIMHLILALVFIAVLIYVVSNRYLAMTANQFSIEETSEGLRVLLPYIILYESWINLHIFGTGPGAQYSENFMMDLNPYGQPIFGTNAFALFFFYFGPFVGLFLLFLLFKVIFKFKSILLLDKVIIYSIVVFLFLANTLGSFEAPRLMGLFGFFLIFLNSARKLGKI